MRKVSLKQKIETDGCECVSTDAGGACLETFINTFMTLVPVVLYVLTGLLIVYLPNFTHITAGILFAFVIIQDRFLGQ